MADNSSSGAAAAEQAASAAPRRRFLRPRFSLAALFGVMTLACVGVWYWYQWPYRVEHVHYGESSDPKRRPMPIASEVEYVRNVWSRHQKTVRHGPWVFFDDKQRKLEEGTFRNGVKHGAFRRYYNTSAGGREWEEHYDRGILHGPRREWSKDGQLLSEVNYDRGRLHGPYFKSRSYGLRVVEGANFQGLPDGEWVWRFHYAWSGQYEDRARFGEVRGKWERGVPVGTWEACDRERNVYLTVRFEDGRLVEAKPDALEPRLAELLARGAITDPQVLPKLFQMDDYAVVDSPLKEALWAVADDLPMRLSSLDALEKLAAERDRETEPPPHGSRIPYDAPVTYRAQHVPHITALRDILEPRGLVCDYRHGMLWITTPDRAGLPDATNVSQLVPPPGSRLEALWQQPCEMLLLDDPLDRSLFYWSRRYQVRIDGSRLPSSFRETATIRLTVHGVAFKHCLGLMLEQIGCRASLEGETIVIELQEGQPSQVAP